MWQLKRIPSSSLVLLSLGASDTPSQTLISPVMGIDGVQAALNIEKGWIVGVKQRPSPNFTVRPNGAIIDLLVLHNISLPPEQFGGGNIESFFLNQLDHDAHPYFETIRGMQVSAHCLIDRQGEIIQFVSLDDRAWHAGRSEFRGRVECNDFSIGIELEGADTIPYTAQQYSSLSSLVQAIKIAYPKIDDDNIVGHSDIAPERKTDPGPAFDWDYFRSLLNKRG